MKNKFLTKNLFFLSQKILLSSKNFNCLKFLDYPHSGLNFLNKISIVINLKKIPLKYFTSKNFKLNMENKPNNSEDITKSQETIPNSRNVIEFNNLYNLNRIKLFQVLQQML